MSYLRSPTSRRRGAPPPADSITALLYPTHGIRDEQKRRGFTPRDHSKDNRRHIKEIQQHMHESKQQQEEAAAAAAASPRTSYKGVKSRVAAQLERPVSAPPRPTRAAPPKNFMLGKPAGSAAWKDPPLLAPTSQPQLTPRQKMKPSVPANVPLARPASGVDFVKRNVESAKLARAR
jgi:hypothetical protein